MVERESPVRDFTAGSRKIEVAMLAPPRASWNMALILVAGSITCTAIAVLAAAIAVPCSAF